MSRNVTIGIAVVILVILLGWFYLKSQRSSYAPAPVQATPSPQAIQPTENPATSSAETPNLIKENAVTITSAGFSPQSITIKAGEVVVWTNGDSADHTVNSAPHPTHTAYPPLNLGVIKPGDKKSLTFPAAGTYKYHDHLNPSLFGSVTVQ